MRPGTAPSPDRAWLPVLAESSLSLGGFYDPASGASDEQIATLMNGTAHPVTVSYQGATAIGQRAVLMQVRQDGAPISSTVDAAIEITSSRSSDGGKHGGIILKDHDAETSTGNFTGVDAGALSSFGGVGHFHVTAFDGTDATVKITDSVDEGVYADHITFTQATDVTYERVASTGTVNRWTRVELAGTFTSITFTVGFARLLQ
jgi:hypothetical protein